jgi:uncharacterized protein (UPF0332 family)
MPPAVNSFVNSGNYEKNKIQVLIINAGMINSKTMQEKFDKTYFSLLKKLYNKRELAMYGDEDSGIPSNELFTKEDASYYLEKTEDYYNQCLTELKDYL